MFQILMDYEIHKNNEKLTNKFSTILTFEQITECKILKIFQFQNIAL